MSSTIEPLDYKNLPRAGKNGTFILTCYAIVWGTATALAKIISEEKGEVVQPAALLNRLAAEKAVSIIGLANGTPYDFYTLAAARAALAARPVKKRGPRT
jgi:hypothetical protein